MVPNINAYPIQFMMLGIYPVMSKSSNDYCKLIINLAEEIPGCKTVTVGYSYECRSKHQQSTSNDEVVEIGTSQANNPNGKQET